MLVEFVVLHSIGCQVDKLKRNICYVIQTSRIIISMWAYILCIYLYNKLSQVSLHLATLLLVWFITCTILFRCNYFFVALASSMQKPEFSVKVIKKHVHSISYFHSHRIAL